jgi:ion channel-forming bestrophin family protein
MHAGRSYKLSEFLVWTRRSIFRLIIISIVATVLYEVCDFKWLAIPWPVIALLGTATAFIIGFKNLQTYNRTWEARQVWGACISGSRAWGIMCRDYLNNQEQAKELIYRHFAWLTALRYQLRSGKEWENTTKAYNTEYRKYYSVPEEQIPLKDELAKYISQEELSSVLTTQSVAVQLLSLQGKTLKKLYDEKAIDDVKFSDMYKAVRDFYDHQGKCERIKNFPYPRQYSSINIFFVKLFCLLLPLGMIGEFDELNNQVSGFLQGYMVWFVIPFSVIISWVFTSLEQVGESTENPFEGSANDVPISQMSRAVEIDMREMLGETDLPEVLKAQNNIIM